MTFIIFWQKWGVCLIVSKLWYWFDRGSLQVQVNFQRPLIAFLCCMYQTCSYFGKLRRMFSWVFRITWPLICLIFRRQCSAVSSWPVIGPSEAPASQSWLRAGSYERHLRHSEARGEPQSDPGHCRVKISLLLDVIWYEKGVLGGSSTWRYCFNWGNYTRILMKAAQQVLMISLFTSFK